MARQWDAISDLKPNCHPGPLLPEINGSYQRCPPNSSQRMGPSLFSNCVKILWNLKKIVRSNDDGSSGVNLEYHESFIFRSASKKALFPEKWEIWKSVCFDFYHFLAWSHQDAGVTQDQEWSRLRSGVNIIRAIGRPLKTDPNL